MPEYATTFAALTASGVGPDDAAIRAESVAVGFRADAAPGAAETALARSFLDYTRTGQAEEALRLASTVTAGRQVAALRRLFLRDATILAQSYRVADPSGAAVLLLAASVGRFS